MFTSRRTRLSKKTGVGVTYLAFGSLSHAGGLTLPIIFSVIPLAVGAGPARMTSASRAAQSSQAPRPLPWSRVPREWCTVQDPRAVRLHRSHTANLDGRRPMEALRLCPQQRRCPFPISAPRTSARNTARPRSQRAGSLQHVNVFSMHMCMHMHMHMCMWHSRRQAAALFTAACRAASTCAASRSLSAAGHRSPPAAGDLGGSTSSSRLQCSRSWRCASLS